MKGCVFPQLPRPNFNHDYGDTREFQAGEKVCARLVLEGGREAEIFPARYVRPHRHPDNGLIYIHIIRRLEGGQEMWYRYENVGKYDTSLANKAKLRSMKNQMKQYPENIFYETGKYLGPDPKIFTRRRSRKARRTRQNKSLRRNRLN